MRKTRILLAALVAMAAAVGAYAEDVRTLVLFKRGTRSADRAAEIQSYGGRILRNFAAVDITLANFPQEAARAIYTRTRSNPNTRVWRVEKDTYRHWLNDSTYATVPSAKAVLENLKTAERPVYTAPVAAAKATRYYRASDNSEMPWGIVRVNAPAAWPVTDGHGVKVGIIDTGIDLTHPDLAANIAGGYNATNPKLSPADDHGHGTHVAGTIAAVYDSKGVVGVAPKASLYAVKALDRNGSGNVSDIVAAIDWAVQNHMQVVNMSLGSPQESEAIAQAVLAAYNNGVTVVCAAGNDSGAVNYPAAGKGALAISASNISDKIAYFSSRGPQIKFIAPGVDIYSTIPNGYEKMDGTSMASPHVAGLAALAVGAGAANPDMVLAMLKGAATPLPGLDADEQGFGMIDAAKIKAARRR